MKIHKNATLYNLTKYPANALNLQHVSLYYKTTKPLIRRPCGTNTTANKSLQLILRAAAKTQQLVVDALITSCFLTVFCDDLTVSH